MSIICGTAAKYLEHLKQLIDKVTADARFADTIDKLGDFVLGRWIERRSVFLMGNGGSAATASHCVCDWIKTAAVTGQERLRAFCLNDNVGLLTAISNDFEYADVFAYQLETLARPGDLLVAISAGGASPNVLRACEWAKANGVGVVGVAGFGGGELARMADLAIVVPSSNYGAIEDMHLAIGHMVAHKIKTVLRTLEP